MKLLVIFVGLSTFVITVTGSSFCYWNSGCPYKYFSSKTPYNSARGDIRDSLIKLKDCEPIGIWGIVRHGQRYPSNEFKKHMKDILYVRDSVVASYVHKNCTLCAQDVQNLKNWQVDKNLFTKTNELTEEGYQEMIGIGSRLKEAFPEMLTDLKRGEYLMRPAIGNRIVKSAEGFAKGLGNNLSVEKPKNSYDILAPYSTCGKYQRDIKQNPDTYEEVNKFRANPEFSVVKDKLARRLGVNITFTDELVEALYDMCRFTWSGIENKFSPWCAIFTTPDLLALEYIGDLSHFYRNSYGSKNNEKFGHIVLSDLLRSFQDIKQGSGRKITAYISHATMLNMIFTALNIYKDEARLTGAQRNPKRKWRTSKLSIFGVNFIAVLNRCNKTGADDFNVVFYLNEEPILSICKEGVCTWEEFEGKMKPFLETTADFCEFQSKPYD